MEVDLNTCILTSLAFQHVQVYSNKVNCQILEKVDDINGKNPEWKIIYIPGNQQSLFDISLRYSPLTVNIRYSIP